MRYSKTRIIATTIISISCFILVIFALYKGVEFAKKANGAGEPTVKASVTEEKKVKKKANTVVKSIKKKISKTTKKTTKKIKKKTTAKKVVKKDTTKKTETKVETKVKTEEKKTETTKKEEVKEQETPKQEIKKEEEEKPTFDNGIVGKYVIKELTYKGKTYTKKEIDKLIEEGYSMKLEIKDSGIASLNVLSINKLYEVDDTYFDDGQDKITYSHSNTRIRITVDGTKMLFVKK